MACSGPAAMNRQSETHWRSAAASLLAATFITIGNHALAAESDDLTQMRAERDRYREAYRKATLAKKAETEEAEEEYGTAHSWELGGAFSFLWQSDEYTIEMSPSFGYFFYERFELSAIFTMSFENEEIEGTSSRESSQSYAFILEPSYHIKIIKQLFIPIGLGTGVGYDGDNVDFELIPRTGLNIVFTSHGVLTPAVRVPILFDEDGTTVQVGATLGYTVAF